MLLSIGQIKDEIERAIGQPVDRDAVAYAIRKVNVQPVQRAGLVRLFRPETVATVCEFIQARRTDRSSPTNKEISGATEEDSVPDSASGNRHRLHSLTRRAPSPGLRRRGGGRQ